MHLARDPEPDAVEGVGVGLRVLVVAASAVGGMLAEGSVTGSPVADGAWRALAAAAVTAAALWAGPVARVLPAVVAAAVAVAAEAWGVAAVACAVLIGTAVAPHRGRGAPLANAVLTGAGVQLLLRLPDLEPARTTAALGTAAALAVLVAGWRGLPARGRRRSGWGVAILGGLGVAASAPFLVAGLLAWGDVGRGAGEANAWRVATGEGDDVAAAAHLDGARAAFGDAASRLDGWWAVPARFVPLVGQHRQAAAVGVDAGVRLVRSADDLLEVADPQELSFDDGRLDLDLVAEVQPPLGAGLTTLEQVAGDLAAVADGWLLPFVNEDLRVVRAQVEDARDDAALAWRVLDVVPGLLGGEGPRRYFVMFTSPAETRELGGFMGNWGILTAVDGRLDLVETGRAADLNDPSVAAGLALSDPGAFPARFVRTSPAEFWQNLPSSPDLPTVAAAVADLYPSLVGDRVDGVLVVDPLALAALLELTGPVDVPDLDRPLTPEDAADFLLRDQYLELPELAERVDFLAGAAEATFDRLTDGELPGPATIADVLAEAVDGRHLLFWPLGEDAQPLMRELGLDGAFPTSTGDLLAVARANAGPNKLDAYLDEELVHEVVVDPTTGVLEATLRATYTNRAPAGLPDYVAGNDAGLPPGTARFLWSVWTPHLRGRATVDDAPRSMERQVELGVNRYLTMVTVPRGESVTVEVRLIGAVDPSPYRLTVLRQPLSVASDLRVQVRDPRGEPLPGSSAPTVLGG